MKEHKEGWLIFQKNRAWTFRDKASQWESTLMVFVYAFAIVVLVLPLILPVASYLGHDGEEKYNRAAAAFNELDLATRTDLYHGAMVNASGLSFDKQNMLLNERHHALYNVSEIVLCAVRVYIYTSTSFFVAYYMLVWRENHESGSRYHLADITRAEKYHILDKVLWLAMGFGMIFMLISYLHMMVAIRIKETIEQH